MNAALRIKLYTVKCKFRQKTAVQKTELNLAKQNKENVKNRDVSLKDTTMSKYNSERVLGYLQLTCYTSYSLTYLLT